MGFELLDNLSTEGPLKALKMAIKNRKYNTPLIQHSDRGLQYCSQEYVKVLKEQGVQISMTQNADPYENAIAERINGILKYEFLLIDGFKNQLEALQVIKNSIGIYNQQRPHWSCQLLTPEKAHLQHQLTYKKWNKKTPKAIASEV